EGADNPGEHEVARPEDLDRSRRARPQRRRARRRHAPCGRAPRRAGRLFVEDADLLTLAGWPAATETRLFGSASQPLGGNTLEATLRAHAAALERRLDALAREIGVPWSFRTARGRVEQQALSLAATGDWIVLAGAST